MVATLAESEPNKIQLYEMTSAGLKNTTITLGANARVFFLHDQASFSPDGSFLAAFGGEGNRGSVWVWDARSGTQIGVIRENHSPVWSNDSRVLVTRGPGAVNTGDGTASASWGMNGIQAGDSLVNVWDISPPAPAYFVPQAIESLAFTPESKLLVSNGIEWEVVRSAAGLALTSIPQQLPAASSVLSNGDQVWVSNGSSASLHLWQLAPNRTDTTLDRPDYSGLISNSKGEVFANASKISVSPDGQRLLMYSPLNVRSGDGGSYGIPESVLELWDIPRKERIGIWNKDALKTDFVDLKFSPDGTRVAIASRDDPGISIRAADDGRELVRFGGPASHALTFSPDGKLLIAAGFARYSGGENPIYVYEVQTGRCAQTMNGHGGSTTTLALSPNGDTLASGAGDRSIKLWNIRTGRLLASWEAHNANVTALAFSTDGTALASGSSDGALKLWNLPRIRAELRALGLDW